MTSLMSAGSNYPAVQRGGNSPRLDWLSSPTLNIPDWPKDSQPTDVYTASPISSPGVSTPSNGDSWNAFDESFRKSNDPSPLTSPTMDSFDSSNSRYPPNPAQMMWNSTWSPAVDPRGPGSSYLPLSLIYDPSTACDYEDVEETEMPIYSYRLSGLDETPQSPRKAAWGNSKHTRRASESSKPDRHSSHSSHSSRTKRRNSSTRAETGASPKGHQLRSTKQGQRISYAENDTKNDGLKGARTSHNLVEKQYRTRLNGQFSTLLSALPKDVVGTEVDGFGAVDSGAEKRVSKAEVLVLAKKHIENLERSKKSLELDKRALIEDLQQLKGAWVRIGGEVMP
ncbi:hypothetical protein EG329_006997 [Mollisiaceae sp. DMI_Dod_QoI]|nr:hypothetical protein EG329_006997 [Helotiales sp. DMI_Dod_QoI]